MGQTTNRLPDVGGNAESSRLINAAVQEVVRTNERRAAVEAAVAPPGQMRQRLTLAALAVTVPVLLLSFMTNVLGVSLGSLFTPAPPEAVARRQAEDALRQAVQEIESYRRDFAELPTTLSLHTGSGHGVRHFGTGPGHTIFASSNRIAAYYTGSPGCQLARFRKQKGSAGL